MSETDNPNIFSSITVKALIEQKWPLTKKNVIMKLLLPYLFFLTVFSFYTINDLETSYADRAKDLENPDPSSSFRRAVSTGCRVLILIFTFYFFTIEIMQCLKEGFWAHIA